MILVTSMMTIKELSDVFHRSASYVPESQLAGGKTFNIIGGDGIQRTLLQVRWQLNGKTDIFEYIIEPLQD